MMAPAFITLFILFIVVDLLINRDPLSPVCLFCSLWVVISIFSSLSLFGFTGYSDRTMVLVGIGVLAFVVGAFPMSLIAPKSHRRNELETVDSTIAADLEMRLHLDYRLLKFLLLVVCVGTVFSLYYTFRMLSSGAGIGDVRMGLLGYSDEATISNPVVNGFVNYICGPIKTVLLPLAIVYIVNGKHIGFSIIALLNILLGVVSSGGRITVLYAIIQAVAAIRYYGILISRKTKRRIIVLVVLGIALVAFLTIVRGSASIVYSIYSYFSIPFAIFSRCADVVDRANFHSYGASFLYPFFYVVNAFSGALGIESSFLADLVYYVGYPQDTWFASIFPSGVFNAFSSLFYFFYMDFREPGIVLLSGAFGVIAGLVYSKATRWGDSRFFLWYLLIAQSIFGSFMIWQLGNTKFFLSVFILCFLLRNRRRTGFVAARNNTPFRGYYGSGVE